MADLLMFTPSRVAFSAATMNATGCFRGSSYRVQDDAEFLSLHSQTSDIRPARPSPSQHRSVKRKFDVVCEKTPCRDKEIVPGSTRDVRIERHFKGPSKCYSNTGTVLEGESNIADFHLPRSSVSGIFSASDIIVHSQKQLHWQRWEEGLDTGIHSFGLQSRQHAANLEQCIQSEDGLDDNLIIEQQALHGKSDCNVRGSEMLSIEKKEERKKVNAQSAQGCSGSYNVIAIKQALWDENEALRRLKTELEEERSAASSAANEAMAMIARLQEEKAAVLMEARQFKRIAEEREIHHQEAIACLKEMLLGKEEETMFLKNELLAFRQMFFQLEDEGLGKNFDHINSVDEVKTLENKRTDCIHSTEDLKSWPSSFCDSGHYSGTVTTDCSGDNFEEDLLQSGFVGRTSRINFQGLITDHVKSNLVTFFDRAGQDFDDSRKCAAEDLMGERLKINNRGDMTLGSIICTQRNVSTSLLDECWKEVDGCGEKIDLEEVRSTRGIEDLRELVYSDRSLEGSSGIKKAMNTPVPCKKNMPENRVESSGSGRGDSTVSLWERISKLEHRLDTFRMKERHPKGRFVADPRSLFNAASYQEEFGCREQILRDEHFSQENFVGETGCPERAAKIHCREGLQGVTNCLNSLVEPLATEKKCDSDMHCEIWSTASEQHCYEERMLEMGEGMHDIYEVHQEHLQSTPRLKPLANVNKMENQYDNRLGKPDLPSTLEVQIFKFDNLEEQKAVVNEVGEIQGSSFTGNKFSVMSKNGTPECSMVTRDEIESLSEEDIWQLTLRLQALEAERMSMNQAITSLRKENGELKLLQEIAQQLQDLKGTVNPSKQLKGHLQPEQLSLLSFFKGLKSYVSCSILSPGSNQASSSPKNVDLGVMQRNRVGLCHLLEASPYCRTNALMTRDIKVKVPIRDGFWPSANGIFA